MALITMLRVVYVLFPLTTVLYIVIATIASAITYRKTPDVGRRRIHHAILTLIVASYLAEASISVCQHGIFDQGQSRLIQLILLGSSWSWIALRPSDPRHILTGVAIISALFEIPLLVISIRGIRSNLTIASNVIQCSRLLLVMTVAAISVRKTSVTTQSHVEDEAASAYRDDPDTESQNTLQPISGELDDETNSDDEDVIKIKRRRAQRLKETGGWLTYLKDFAIFLPCLIPRHDRKVQLCFLISVVCVAGNRALNILIPRQIGIVTDMVLDKQSPYGALAVWLLLSLVDEFRGLGLVQNLVKIPIQQFTYRELTNTAFNHVMKLSMDFHADRDAAEVIKAIEQGTSINFIVEMLAIELFPMLCDLIIAIGLFWYKFGALVALIVFLAAIVIVSVEVTLLQRNTGNKRESTRTAREESRIMHQALQGWQTVTYFNMFGFERRRFAQAIEAHQDASRAYQYFYEISNAGLDSLETITFFLVASLVLYEVGQGQASAGDFVFVLQYWQNLVWPIKLLSFNSKRIMESLVDAERLLALLQTQPTVADKPDGKDLYDIQGRVLFEDVSFSYDPRKPIIQSLSLSASPGETIAFVGATGAGKSTIIKLLLRFYDINSGNITIDGQDIRDISLSSLRSCIGIVPQDPLLFNASILENLRYARPEASNDEVFEACRKAAVHDKIVGFADGYETKVGEQGVKLSGGEIQRLAIARVFLKNPPILILDEATSAVDTETEHNIQQALNGLTQGRTTFIIAHRLSTIIHADKIMVVSDGEVVESGTHDELIRVGGRYMSLWSKQSSGGLNEPDLRA